MRGVLAAVALGWGAALLGGGVAFEGKGEGTIGTSGPLAFAALERQDYAGGEWVACGFLMQGAAEEDAALMGPAVNVQTEGRWRLTLTAREQVAFDALSLTVRIFNSAGAPQGAGTVRTARFRAEAGGRSAEVVAACQGAATLGAQGNVATLDFGGVAVLEAGEALTIVCERAEETLGCFFGLAALAWGAPTVTVGAEGAVWPEGLAEAGVRFAGGTLLIPEGTTVRRLWTVGEPAGGTVRVEGTLAGEDAGEPAVPAFALPPGVRVEVARRGWLLMDGRLSCTVAPETGARLGAASAEGTLTLDDLTGEGLAIAVQGVVETYRREVGPAVEGAAWVRLARPGWQVSVQ